MPAESQYSYEPSARKIDYVEKTSDTTISATSAATADTCITSSPIVYPGGMEICIEIYSPSLVPSGSNSADLIVTLWEDSTDLGIIGQTGTTAASPPSFSSMFARMFRTPSAGSHTYIVKAWRTVGNGTFSGGTGGAGYIAAYMRITKA